MTGRMVTMNGRPGFALAPEMTRWLDRALETTAWSDGEVVEKDGQAVISIDLPGVKVEQITVTAEHRTLQVKAERDGRAAIIRNYLVEPKFDLTQVQANLALGVLTLTLPKAAEAMARKITITTE